MISARTCPSVGGIQKQIYVQHLTPFHHRPKVRFCVNTNVKNYFAEAFHKAFMLFLLFNLLLHFAAGDGTEKSSAESEVNKKSLRLDYSLSVSVSGLFSTYLFTVCIVNEAN